MLQRAITVTLFPLIVCITQCIHVNKQHKHLFLVQMGLDCLSTAGAVLSPFHSWSLLINISPPPPAFCVLGVADNR